MGKIWSYVEIFIELIFMVYTYNSSMWEMEAEWFQVQGHARLHRKVYHLELHRTIDRF